MVMVEVRGAVLVVEAGKKKKGTKTDSAEGVLWIRKEWRNPEGRNKAGKKGTWRPSKLTTARSKLDRIEIEKMMVVEVEKRV